MLHVVAQVKRSEILFFFFFQCVNKSVDSLKDYKYSDMSWRYCLSWLKRNWVFWMDYAFFLIICLFIYCLALMRRIIRWLWQVFFFHLFLYSTIQLVIVSVIKLWLFFFCLVLFKLTLSAAMSNNWAITSFFFFFLLISFVYLCFICNFTCFFFYVHLIVVNI